MLGGRFGYFLFFSARGGQGAVRGAERGGGDRFLLKIPGVGGVGLPGREGSGAGRVPVANLGIFFCGGGG